MKLFDSSFEQNLYITQKEATYRAKHIKNINYKLSLILPESNFTISYLNTFKNRQSILLWVI